MNRSCLLASRGGDEIANVTQSLNRVGFDSIIESLAGCCLGTPKR
jgi:hypothetical protein